MLEALERLLASLGQDSLFVGDARTQVLGAPGERLPLRLLRQNPLEMGELLAEAQRLAERLRHAGGDVVGRTNQTLGPTIGLGGRCELRSLHEDRAARPPGHSPSETAASPASSNSSGAIAPAPSRRAWAIRSSRRTHRCG